MFVYFTLDTFDLSSGTFIVRPNQYKIIMMYTQQKGVMGAVFQQEKEPWELAIEKMSVQVEMMMKWQQIQMNKEVFKTLPI